MSVAIGEDLPRAVWGMRALDVVVLRLLDPNRGGRRNHDDRRPTVRHCTGQPRTDSIPGTLQSNFQTWIDNLGTRRRVWYAVPLFGLRVNVLGLWCGACLVLVGIAL